MNLQSQNLGVRRQMDQLRKMVSQKNICGRTLRVDLWHLHAHAQINTHIFSSAKIHKCTHTYTQWYLITEELYNLKLQ